jgi:oxygen-dependent protoporphyrinogen oxidase
MEKVIVIGGGISGLACAYRLGQLGIDCLVLESTGRPGGLIGTIRRDGCLFETGPQCPRFPASVWGLVCELGLEGEFVAGEARAKRYILRRGRLYNAPFSPMGLITTGLLGLASKLRVLAEPFAWSQPPLKEETLADFVQRKFGQEVLDNLVDPIVSTVFFGDSRKMGMQSAFPLLVEWERNSGSVARGAIRARNHRPSKGRSLLVTDALPALGSFTSGMARLSERLAQELKRGIHYGAEVSRVAPAKNGQIVTWQVGLSSGQQLLASHVILAVPAYVAARLLYDSTPALASQLEAIEYAPMCSVSSVYRRSAVAHPLDGFGFMVPRSERMQTICTFWNSSLFRQRAPEDMALMTTFARVTPGSSAEDHVAQAVEDENAKILKINGRSLDRQVWQDRLALPQYNVGHVQRVRKIAEMLPSIQNLHVTGNFLRGRSIGDCVDQAFVVAAEVDQQLRDSQCEPSRSNFEGWSS